MAGILASERIVTELGHDDVIVGLRRAADPFESEALVV
jgi:hypothetical protein